MELLDARQRLMQVACKCYSLDTQRQEMGFVDARCHYEYNRTLQKFSMNANNYTSRIPGAKLIPLTLTGKNLFYVFMWNPTNLDHFSMMIP